MLWLHLSHRNELHPAGALAGGLLTAFDELAGLGVAFVNVQVMGALAGCHHPFVIRTQVEGARNFAGGKLTNAAEFAGLGIDGETGNGVVATVGGVHKRAVIRNLNICAGVFAAIKSRWQRAGRVEGLELAGRAVERIRRDAVALFIIAIHNWQFRVKSEMPRFQPSAGLAVNGSFRVSLPVLASNRN